MELAAALVVIWLVFALVFGGLGIYVAEQKHRSEFEGLLLGAYLGIVGVLIEALLPSQ